MSSNLRATYVQTDVGRLLLVVHVAGGSVSPCVVFVPPFAEEMNKSRRQFTVTAQALGEQGISCVLVDLYGTGDSDGEFRDASWATWVANVGTAIDWLVGEGLSLHAIVSLRLGSVIAADAIRQSTYKPKHHVLWQPVLDGSMFLGQFLRLKSAASLVGAGGFGSSAEFRQELMDTGSLEVAGYQLSKGLYEEIDSLRLADRLSGDAGAVSVFEIGRRERDTVSAAMQRFVDCSVAQGFAISSAYCIGEPFWSATEVVVNPALSAATAAALAVEH